MSRVISVLSGKGGVGKTFVTANLAAALSDIGKKVLCVDFDIGLRNLDLVLGLENASVTDISDLGSFSPDELLIKHPIYRNLCMINAPEDLEFLDGKVSFASIVSGVYGDSFDIILIDCPAGAGTELIETAVSSDEVILVTTAENISIRDCEKVSSVLQNKGQSEIYLIVNQVVPKVIKKNLMANIDEIMDIVSARLIGLIPEVRQVPVTVNGGKLSYGEDKVLNRIFSNIANRVCGNSAALYKFW